MLKWLSCREPTSRDEDLAAGAATTTERALSPSEFKSAAALDLSLRSLVAPVDVELVVDLLRPSGNICPIAGMDGGGVEFEVSARDGAQLGNVSEPISQLGPSRPTVAVGVEMGFESAGRVAPHGAGCWVGRDGPKEVQVHLRWPVGNVEDTVESRPVECVGDEGDVAGEFSPALARGTESVAPLVSVVVEVL
jgi:hypothetical protein